MLRLGSTARLTWLGVVAGLQSSTPAIQSSAILPTMDSQISTTLARYKFHTIFDGDSVEHTTHRSDLQSRQRRVVVKTRWTREKELGSGAFGIVWREREAESKELRAVKIVPKHFLNVREIGQLAELRDVRLRFMDLFYVFLDR